jgi:hypothetical protein
LGLDEKIEKKSILNKLLKELCISLLYSLHQLLLPLLLLLDLSYSELMKKWLLLPKKQHYLHDIYSGQLVIFIVSGLLMGINSFMIN